MRALSFYISDRFVQFRILRDSFIHVPCLYTFALLTFCSLSLQARASSFHCLPLSGSFLLLVASSQHRRAPIILSRDLLTRRDAPLDTSVISILSPFDSENIPTRKHRESQQSHRSLAVSRGMNEHAPRSLNARFV